jgi:hypothetical protein
MVAADLALLLSERFEAAAAPAPLRSGAACPSP